MPKYETDLRRAIISAYQQRYWLVMNMAPGPGGPPKGCPDLLCVGRQGRTVWIEVKREQDGRLAPLQRHYGKILSALGHRVIVADTIEAAIAPLREEEDD